MKEEHKSAQKKPKNWKVVQNHIKSKSAFWKRPTPHRLWWPGYHALEGHKMTIDDGMWNPIQDAGGLAEGLVQDPRILSQLKM